MTDEQRELWKFTVENLPYAIHLNPNCEFSQEEFDESKKILETDLTYFKGADQLRIIQAFACLIRSIKNDVKQLEQLKWLDWCVFELYPNCFTYVLLKIKKACKSIYYKLFC